MLGRLQARASGSRAIAERGRATTATGTPTARPRSREIDFKGVPDESSLTSGLLTGGIDGTYPQALSTLDQLRASQKLTVSGRPVVRDGRVRRLQPKGVLGDVRVRQALSMAIDRKAYIQTPSTTGTAAAAADAGQPGSVGLRQGCLPGATGTRCPTPTRTSRRPRTLIKAGGRGRQDDHDRHDTGGRDSLATSANASAGAGEAIGLKVEVQGRLGGELHQLLHRPQGARGRRRVPDRQLPRLRRSRRALQHVRPARAAARTTTASRTPQITSRAGRGPRDERPGRRAPGWWPRRATGSCEQLPWIPMAAPDTVLITRSKLTGAPGLLHLHGRPLGQPARREVTVGRFVARRAGDAGRRAAGLELRDLRLARPLAGRPARRRCPAAARCRRRRSPSCARSTTSTTRSSSATVHWLGNVVLHGDLGTLDRAARERDVADRPRARR